ncbi:MAG: NAD-binding protein [Desulfuromonadaceae bacterium]|nr:NAD-binding protein [Desulfuromonadaceae bacterium]
MRVILAGEGRIIYHLARQFRQKHGMRLVIVTPNEDEARTLSRRLGVQVILNDATVPAILEEAGALRADAVLALTPHDEDNLAICQIARQLYQVPRVIALVNDPDNEEIFHRLGVTVAISATRILSILLEEEAGFEAIGQMIALAKGRVAVSEVVLRHEAPAVGRRVDSLELPEDALIGGIIRSDNVLIPKGPTQLQGEDRIILIATEDCLHQAISLLAGTAAE